MPLTKINKFPIIIIACFHIENTIILSKNKNFRKTKKKFNLEEDKLKQVNEKNIQRKQIK